MFNTLESSTQDANSVELYRITCGPNVWEWCNGEVPITWRGKTYQPLAISNNGIRQSGDGTTNDTIVTLPADNTLMQMLFADVPTVPVRLIMRKKHHRSSDAPIHIIADLVSFGRKDGQTKICDLTFYLIDASFKRSGARMSWSKQCQHALYDRNCTVDPNDFDTSITIDRIEEAKIYSDDLNALPAHYLSNGYMEWTNAFNVQQRRAIENNSKDAMTVFGRATGITPGMVVKVYPGCPRTVSACDNKFNNMPNYGGVPFLSEDSPFRGNPTW